MDFIIEALLDGICGAPPWDMDRRARWVARILTRCNTTNLTELLGLISGTIRDIRLFCFRLQYELHQGWP
jgi:hypothetical protein